MRTFQHRYCVALIIALGSAQSLACQPPAGFVNPPLPKIAPLDQLLAHTEHKVVDKSLSAVMQADYIYVLSGGAVQQEGTHEELMAEEGDYARMKAYDLLVQAESGLASITGHAAGPGRVGVSVVDIACGMNAHAAVLEALIARGISGKGTGIAVSHRQIAAMPDLTTTAAVESGCRAYAMAGLGPAEIDHVMVYDAFTITTLLFLEDLGFCPKGEGGAFISSGAIAPGGTLPVNTNGGGLSCNHPGMYGLFTLIEAVEQLRGACGARQVPGVEVALAHANGGVLSSQATAILGSPATV